MALSSGKSQAHCEVSDVGVKTASPAQIGVLLPGHPEKPLEP
jgi:hypothetical protein